MRTSTVLLGLSKLAVLALFSSTVAAQHFHTADAMFGRGLNTAQPGNPVNHVISPKIIFIKAGGVVDFTVAGLHDIIVFKPGFTLEDLKTAGGGDYPSTPPALPTPPGGHLFVLPPLPHTAAAPWPPALVPVFDQIYYLGINPAGGPAATPATANPSNAVNRAEPVAFLNKGWHLVICNIRPHLLDGMYALVLVY